jgi:hypothetical protein
MSERDLKRIEVLTEVLAARRTVASAAAVLGLGVRQTFRLLAQYQEQGGGGLIHKARGRASNRQINAGVRKYGAGHSRVYFRFKVERLILGNLDRNIAGQVRAHHHSIRTDARAHPPNVRAEAPGCLEMKVAAHGCRHLSFRRKATPSGIREDNVQAGILPGRRDTQCW